MISIELLIDNRLKLYNIEFICLTSTNIIIRLLDIYSISRFQISFKNKKSEFIGTTYTLNLKSDKSSTNIFIPKLGYLSNYTHREVTSIFNYLVDNEYIQILNISYNYTSNYDKYTVKLTPKSLLLAI